MRNGILILLIVCSAACTVTSAFAAGIAADTIRRTRRSSTADSSRYVEINNIILAGNKITKAVIILREITLNKGDVIQEKFLTEVVELDRRKIFNLQLFHYVQVYILKSAENKVDLLVEVEERWYTFPIPIFRLTDRNFNEWWENYNHDFRRVNYGLELYQYNLWGRNQTLNLEAQFGFQNRFKLMYQVPFLNKRQKAGLIVQMDYVEAKNVADSTVDHKLDFFKFDRVLRSTRGIAVTYTYRKNFYDQHRIRYEVRQTDIADTLRNLNPDYLGNGSLRQRYDAVTYEFVSDHRDVVAYPLQGYMFTLHLERSGVALNKDLSKTNGSVSFAGFRKLKRNFFVSNFSHVYVSTPNNIPYYNYSAMGYSKTLVRGYEIYVIEGPQFFLNKTTLKKRIFSRNWDLDFWPLRRFNYFPLNIYLKTYADWGYVHNYRAYAENDINTRLANRFLGGAGVGIDIVAAYDVVVRLEYSFTSRNTSGFFLNLKKEF